jgi:hypothetical protein
MLEGSRIYPNPATSRFTLDIEMNQNADVNVEIFDITGQKSSEYYLGGLPSGMNSVEMPVAELQNGIYIVVINAGNERTMHKLKVTR